MAADMLEHLLLEMEPLDAEELRWEAVDLQEHLSLEVESRVQVGLSGQQRRSLSHSSLQMVERSHWRVRAGRSVYMNWHRGSQREFRCAHCADCLCIPVLFLLSNSRAQHQMACCSHLRLHQIGWCRQHRDHQ